MYIDFRGLHCDESFILAMVGIDILFALWNFAPFASYDHHCWATYVH